MTGKEDERWHQYVYRVFYYDALPYDGKSHHPFLNCAIDFARTDVARARNELFELLRRERKLALRFGRVALEHDWAISTVLTKKLLRTRTWLQALDRLDSHGVLKLSAEEIRDPHQLRELWRGLDAHAVTLGFRQKGVDMRIGVDIAALTLKQHVDELRSGLGRAGSPGSISSPVDRMAV